MKSLFWSIHEILKYMIIRLGNNIKISAYIIYRLKNTANPFKIGIDGAFVSGIQILENVSCGTRH